MEVTGKVGGLLHLLGKSTEKGLNEDLVLPSFGVWGSQDLGEVVKGQL